ncbi:methionyl-tRNA formyltransferase [Ekhidna sp.]|uniref:methionyl-tRNA formyltransferase n=1 Tax=Ekhidna sp. TaxID=2608089 RepID=UPI003297A7FA
MKIALLISGHLGYLLFKQLLNDYLITAVFTDKNSQEIIKKCNSLSLPCFVGNPREGRASEFLKMDRPNVLLSVNYLFLIQYDIIQWPTLVALNVHGSLLPRYRGRTPHVWSIINGESKAGITAHVIEEECDSGDIVAQVSIDIEENDTGGDLLEKYKVKYPELINGTLKDIEKDSLKRVKQDEQKATYFGKRTPGDGLIDWNWQRERIRNWVRAQASPYPGAFSFYKTHKLIIDEVVYSDYGFQASQTNGTILNTEHGIVVKCPNGAVMISKLRTTLPSDLSEGYILN